MKILFVCRGNAFRSIIAEAYLKSLKITNVQCFSCGIVADEHRIENIPHFQKTLALLDRHGIKKYAKTHYGDQLQQRDLDAADLVIFMNQRVFNDSSQLNITTRYLIWTIDDVGERGPIPSTDYGILQLTDVAFKEIKSNIDKLVETINA